MCFLVPDTGLFCSFLESIMGRPEVFQKHALIGKSDRTGMGKVCRKQVELSVIIIVTPLRADCMSVMTLLLFPLNSLVLGDIGECAISVIHPKEVRVQPVIGDKNIQETVIVIIPPIYPSSIHLFQSHKPCLTCYIRKGLITIIFPEDVWGAD